MEGNININELIPVENERKLGEALKRINDMVGVKPTNDEEAQNVANLDIEIAGMIKGIESDREVLVKPYREPMDKINARYREVRVMLEGKKRMLGAALAQYDKEQRLKQLELQKKRELEAAEARRKAEAEAAKAAEKAEALREAGKIAQAEKAEAKSAIAERTAAAIVAPIVESAAKVEGVSFRNKYVVEVENRAEALKALAADPTLSRFLEIDIKGLERWVASLGGEGVPLPVGLRIGVEPVTVVRGKR
jgi:hypothetical protein